jgi:predicted Rossmann fold flavoprotein
MNDKKKLIVIGGGAAGFFCAINAARLNPLLEVILIEKNNKLLSKVSISGGGRCNVTHACTSISEMVKKYPRGDAFVKKTFHQFFTNHTIEWFKERGVDLKTEADGRMFPVTNSSATIIDCLTKEANKYGVQIMMSRDVVAMNLKDNFFNLIFKDNSSIKSSYVCVASGGYPKSIQFEWLKKVGHGIINPVPSLFTFNMPNNDITSLMGVVVPEVVVKITGTKLLSTGPLLITHWGLSGPAILKLSALGAILLAEKNYHFEIQVNWVPSFNETTLLQKFKELRFSLATQKIVNKNPFFLPVRLWEYLLVQVGINLDMRWAELPSKEQNKLIKSLCTHQFVVNGKTTFKEEFVTAGGIDTNEVDAETMQSKIIPQLFFAGEVLNIDGVTGGFNFQNAWTTGWIAAKTIGEMSKKIN